MRLLRISIALSLSVLATACTTIGTTQPTARPTSAAPAQTQYNIGVTKGIDRYIEQRAHVESVGFRLRRANVADCARLNKVKPDLGIIVWSLANFPNEEDQRRLRQSFALTDAVTVAIAITQAPAQRAGLRAGMIITHVNGQELPSGQGATERFIALSNIAARNGPVTLTLNDSSTLSLMAEPTCQYQNILVRSEDNNAGADARSIAITTSLVDFTQSDDEIALILGHELAHKILGHVDQDNPGAPKISKPSESIFPSAILSALTTKAASHFSLFNEQDADYAGLYFMARAGFDVGTAERMWARINASMHSSSMAQSHPTGPERLKALKAAALEIKLKQKTGAPLEFTLKPRQ